MKLSKILPTLILTAFTLCVASASDYTRSVVFTVEADPITSSSSSVTLTVNGQSKTFLFSGTTWNWSVSTLHVNMDVGEETNATVTSSNVSDFRIHARQSRDTDNFAQIYVELGDDSRSSFINKSDAGSLFPVRTRLGNFTRGERAGAFDYERAFNTLWYYDTRPMSGFIRISLGADSSGNSAGYLLYKADKTRSITADGIIYKKGIGSGDAVLLSNSKRQILTGNNLIEIEKGSTNKKAKIKFYPAEGVTWTGSQYTTSASVSLLYEVDESSTEYAADWTRTIGSDVRELEYLQSWDITIITGSSWDRDNIIEVWPWHDPNQSAPRKIKAVTGYRETEILYYGSYSSYYYHIVTDPEDVQTIEVLDGSTVVQSIEKHLHGGIKKGDFWARTTSGGGAGLWIHGQGMTGTAVYTSTSLGSQPDAALGAVASVSRTFLNTDGGLSTIYEYTESSKGEAWPSKIETKKGTTVVGLTTNTYSETTFDSLAAVRKTSVESTGSGTLTTVTLSYADYIADPRFAGKPISVERPDGTKTSYGYERGTWNGTSWSASSSGLDLRTVEVSGVKTNVSVPFSYNDMTSFGGMALDTVRLEYYQDSTQDVSWSPLVVERIYSRFGETVLEANWAHVNGSYQLVNRMINDYTDLGQLKKQYDPDTSLVHYEANYVNGKKQWEEDISGTRTTFAYDANTGLVSSSTKEASGTDVPAVVTTFFYDAAGRLTKETVGSDVHSEKTYDTGDRVITEKSPGGYTTTYSYNFSETSESSVTKTNPDLSTDIRTSYRDGRLKSITGTAVSDVTYSYSYSGSDLVTTRNYTSGPDTTTRADMLGRIKQVDTPKKGGGGVMKTVRNYNTKGQIDKEQYLNGTTPIAPSRINWYDKHGRLWVTGLDTNDSGGLNLNTDGGTILFQYIFMKLKSGNPSYIAQNEWHYRYSEMAYTKANSSSWKVDSQTYEQLSDLDAAKTSYIASRDGEDNWTLTTTSVDTNNNQFKTTSNIPGSANDIEVIYRSGVPITESDAEGHDTDYKYDSRGRLSQSVDPKLYVTSIQYLAGTGLPSKVTENDLLDTTFGYDSLSGVQNYVKDELGNESFSHYVPSSRTYYTWGSGAKSTKTVFDDLGRRKELHTYRTAKSGYSAMSSAGDKTTWTYDSHSGVLLSEEDDLGRKTEYLSYDAAGRLLQRKDPRGAKTNYSYYAWNDTHFSGLLKEVSYDLSGVLSGQNVAATRSEKYEYHQRMLVMTKMRQQRIAGSGTWDDWVYTYDDDPVDHEGGRLLSETLPTYYYGSVNNKINYSYETDAGAFNTSSNLLNGRMSAFNIYSDNTYKSSYVYDSDGRLGDLNWSRLNVSSYKFEYDYHSNTDLIETIRTKESSTTRQLQTRSYATNSHAMTNIKTDNGSNAQVTDVELVRDSLRRIKEHKINGWVGTQASGGGSGIFESYTFTTQGELDVTNTKVLNSNGSGGTQIDFKDRDYDAMGNRDDSGVGSIVENFEAGLNFWSVPGSSQGFKNWYLDQGGMPSGSTGPSKDHTLGNSSGTYLFMETSYGAAYYNGDQAVVESKSFVPSSTSTISFRYHMYGGNMGTLNLEVYNGSSWSTLWSRSGQQHGSSSTSYSLGSVNLSAYSGSSIKLRFRGVAAGGYRGDMAIDDLTITNTLGFQTNSLNQYSSIANNGVLVTPTYDYAGNITYDGLYTYEYDAKNQLVKVNSLSPSKTYDFVYDPLGRRIKQSGNVTLTHFVYQGWNLVVELNSSKSIVKRYVWGLDASNTTQGAGGVGGLLMIEDGSARYYPVYDARYNVVGLQNPSGTLVAWYDYDPFGKLIGSGGSAAGVNPFRFSTKYTDPEIDSDLVYYGLRYYHAEIGRFLNRDPISTSGGLNLYAAMGNDPVNSYDVLGMIPIQQGTDADWQSFLGYTNTAEFYRDGNGSNAGARKFANPSLYWGLSMVRFQQTDITGNEFDVDFDSGKSGSAGNPARYTGIHGDDGDGGGGSSRSGGNGNVTFSDLEVVEWDPDSGRSEQSNSKSNRVHASEWLGEDQRSALDNKMIERNNSFWSNNISVNHLTKNGKSTSDQRKIIFDQNREFGGAVYRLNSTGKLYNGLVAIGGPNSIHTDLVLDPKNFVYGDGKVVPESAYEVVGIWHSHWNHSPPTLADVRVASFRGVPNYVFRRTNFVDRANVNGGTVTNVINSGKRFYDD